MPFEASREDLLRGIGEFAECHRKTLHRREREDTDERKPPEVVKGLDKLGLTVQSERGSLHAIGGTTKTINVDMPRSEVGVGQRRVGTLNTFKSGCDRCNPGSEQRPRHLHH